MNSCLSIVWICYQTQITNKWKTRRSALQVIPMLEHKNLTYYNFFGRSALLASNVQFTYPSLHQMSGMRPVLDSTNPDLSCDTPLTIFNVKNVQPGPSTFRVLDPVADHFLYANIFERL